jgi:plastocyanin
MRAALGGSMRVLTSISLVAVIGIGAWGCSGSGYGSGSTTTAMTPSAPSGASNTQLVTVNVVAIRGAQSFSPNPATLPAGVQVVWHNTDSITHRVVLDNGSVDTGNLAPGASSQPMTIGSSGAAYHCSIHPEMIGSINQDTSQPPPATGGY